MNKPLIALITTTTLVAATHASAITYYFVNYPADQDGHTLSGTVTTDGTLGLIDQTNIISYDLTVTGPTGFSLSTANGDAVSTITNNVNATTTELQLFPYTTESNRLIFAEIESPSFGSTVVEWSRRSTTETYEALRVAFTEVAWSNSSPILNGSDPWVIAVVPEPTSLALLGLGGLMVCFRRRR